MNQANSLERNIEAWGLTHKSDWGHGKGLKGMARFWILVSARQCSPDPCSIVTNEHGMFRQPHCKPVGKIIVSLILILAHAQKA